MQFKAMLFDLDGTLLDTLADLADSVNMVLKGQGYPEHDTGAYRYFIGDGVEKLVERALPEKHRNIETLTSVVEAVRAAYAVNWNKKTKPYNGIAELLKRGRARGLRMTILSNKPEEATRKVVSHFFNGINFEVVRGARADVPKKADPAAALEIARQLHIPPADFLFLGDTGVDMQTAAAAGMYAVGALWGFREAEELLRDGARILVAQPGDLIAWL